uniref:Uncharacterized protein LOC100177662 n=1 Tax=Phallusia mammillata TaxID=59560 RepID=A0A6F9DHD7_9ASCI|nr:uncharacterized protein LOC100177662 [Phallusia mammillata]
MVDPDGDNVTCRYGNSLKEKGGVSHTYPYFSSDPYFAATSECKISYNGGGYKSKVAIALIIEDHPSRDSQYVLSYSSLQFVIEVIALPNYFCSDKPRFVIPTPIHNQIYSLRVGIQWKSTITISSRFRIVEFGVVGVSNVRWKTPTYRGNNQYQVVVNWTPFQNNTGFNYMCYSAADSRGLFAAQRCLAFYVDGIDPCEVNNGGCSDICSSSGGLVTCSCFYSCWELASDGLRCLRKII